MKICIPIVGGKAGFVNLMADDFYKANFYCIYDTGMENNEIFTKEELVTRFGFDFKQGDEKDAVKAIISPNIRPMAFKILVDNDIKVFRPLGNMVDENIRLFIKHELDEHDVYSVERSSGCGSGSCSSCSSTSCSA